MAKEKKYYYIVDKLNRNSVPVLKSALETVPEILEVIIRVHEGVLQVRATKDVEQQIKMTCIVSGTPFRTRIKKKDLF